ncbi:hypothetical protein ASG31_08940 [Chryseobacterium sp. Leaf404]|nr:hypothetical protein ASG31_08940 [Chryseobacterium sp. Leaf404]
MINLIIMAKSLTTCNPESSNLENSFLQGIIAMPARRALAKEKIDSLEKLSGFSESELMKLHGFGKNAMLKLKNHLKEKNVTLKS